MEYFFRKAVESDIDVVWQILQGAIARRKADGSDQWQDGYPNRDVAIQDIEKGYGYVLTYGNDVAGYCALLINDEPAYAAIEGQWLTDGDFVVYHRVALSEEYVGRGLAAKMMEFIESFTKNMGISSLRADTNFDNPGMLRLFDKMGYTYCGEVFFRGGARKAFEKVLP